MAQTPEGKVKAAIKAFLKREGIWFYMPQNIGMGVSGVPDFICCLPEFGGKMFAIEAKAPGKIRNTTALQDAQIAAIRAANGWAIVADDVCLVEEFINACRTASQSTGTQGKESGADHQLRAGVEEVSLSRD